MNENHFVMPPTHANIYPKRCVNDSTTKRVSFANNLNQRKAKIETKSKTDNFDLVLDQQRQEDLRQHAVVQLTTPKLNIVLRKDEKQADLASFLHAACFSPVPSTFIKAFQAYINCILVLRISTYFFNLSTLQCSNSMFYVLSLP